MKYLCLIYTEPERLAAATPQERAAIIDECHAYDEVLRSSGRLIAVEKLAPLHTATTVRVRHEKVSVTDGPFAETEEQLAGLYLIQAADLDEALGIASKIPPLRLGSVEVRPVRELTPR
jgi:hypothetical protein